MSVARDAADGAQRGRAGGVAHEALFYASTDEYLARTVPFVRDGLEAGEEVLVAVGASRIGWLRDELGGDAGAVTFADMAVLGRNPAHIIPEWQAFLEEYAVDGRGVRGIGEPIWPGRSPEALVECHRHEHLLNVAFANGPGWSLLCPYDTAALPTAVIERARATHPRCHEDGAARRSSRYHDVGATPLPDDPLPPAPVDHLQMRIVPGCLPDLRGFVDQHGRCFGLDDDQVADLVLAADELATNTLTHTRDEGILRLWTSPGAVVCEVVDSGHITDPLADRTRPDLGQTGGRGLWMANHVCDLVQVRSSATAGTQIRLHRYLN